MSVHRTRSGLFRLFPLSVGFFAHRAQIREMTKIRFYQHMNPYGHFTLDLTQRIPLSQTTIT